MTDSSPAIVMSHSAESDNIDTSNNLFGSISLSLFLQLRNSWLFLA